MTRTTLLLTERDIARLIDMRIALRVIAAALAAQARGQTVMPPKVYVPLPHQSDFRAMPAYVRRPAACGIKWVNVHPHNRSRGLPTVMGTIIINDPATGFPTAIMDGVFITRLRTGASAGVAARLLARPAARVVGLVGCGAQAFAQLLALQESFALRDIRVWGYRAEEARQFCARHRRRIRARLTPVATVQRCVEDADLIVTITSSRKPLVQRAWVKAGAHINAIGADAPGKQELDPALLRAAKVVVDDREQAIHGGEINVAVAKGQFRPRQIHATLGEIMIGHAKGRTRPADITIFDSTGIAIHDIALGAEALRLARRKGFGRPIQLFSYQASA